MFQVKFQNGCHVTFFGAPFSFVPSEYASAFDSAFHDGGELVFQ